MFTLIILLLKQFHIFVFHLKKKSQPAQAKVCMKWAEAGLFFSETGNQFSLFFLTCLPDGFPPPRWAPRRPPSVRMALRRWTPYWTELDGCRCWLSTPAGHGCGCSGRSTPWDTQNSFRIKTMQQCGKVQSFFTFMHMTKIILNKALCGWRAPQQALNAVIVCLLNVWEDHTCTHSASHTNPAENAVLLQRHSLFEYSDASNADLVACSQSIFELIHMSWWLLSKTPWSLLYFLLIFTTFLPVFSLFCPSFLPSTLPLWLDSLFFFFFHTSFVCPGRSSECGPSSLTGRDWGITEAVDRKISHGHVFPCAPLIRFPAKKKKNSF